MTKKLTGRPSLAYKGVEAATPPNTTLHRKAQARAPLPLDSNNVNIGDFWIVMRQPTDPVPEELWMLARLDVHPGTPPSLKNYAKWVQIYPGNGTVLGFHTDAGNAVPDALGFTTVAGGSNINTSGAANTITVNLNTSIFQPATTADELNGVYGINGNRFLHAYNGNLFAGTLAGSYTLTSTDVVGLGANVLPVLTTGGACTIVGSQSASLMTSAYGNTSCGFSCLDNVVSGKLNLALGIFSGTNLTANDSSNILIGHGGVAGSNHRMYLGLDGAGDGQIDETYVAGVYFRDVDNGSLSFAVIDSTTKMGSYGFMSSDHSISIAIDDLYHTLDFTSAGGGQVLWTPELRFGGASVGITYGVQEGSYIQVGNIIYYRGRIVLTSKGISLGAATIHGLPFASAVETIGTLGYRDLVAPIEHHSPCTTLFTGDDFLTPLFGNSDTGTNLTFTLQYTSCMNTLQLWVSGFYFI